MYSNVIAVSIDLIDICNDLYRRLKVESSAYRKERVIAYYLHAESFSSVCDLTADSAQTYDTEGLACDLGTCKLGLAALNSLGSVLCALEGSRPLCSLDYLS